MPGAAQNDRPPFRQKPAVTATWPAKRTWIAGAGLGARSMARRGHEGNFLWASG